MDAARRFGYPQGGRERRSARRYPIVADVGYKLLEGREVFQAGRGKTVNISSKGILFETEPAVPAGQEIELSIAWPAALPGGTRLQLTVTGRTVRAGTRHTAVELRAYEFRTRALALAASGNGVVLPPGPTPDDRKALRFPAQKKPGSGKDPR